MGIKNIQKIFIFGFASLIFCFGVLLLTGNLLYSYILLVVAFAGVLCMLIGTIYLPQKRMEKTLLSLRESGGWKQCLKNGTAAQKPEFAALCDIVQQCVRDISRENTASLYDKQSQINALQSQINPHFLYNTLECIRGQALMEGANEIAKMAEALSSFFRYSISQKENLVTLRDEMNNIRNYFSIQEYRFNNKFRLYIRLDEQDVEIYDYYMPKLTIQPIVENAIFHGLESKGDEGDVIIDLVRTPERILIMISDNGVGMSPDAVDRLNSKIRGEIPIEDQPSAKSSGIALVNVNRRIQLYFGEAYGVKVYSTVNRGTDVEICLPLLKDKIKLKQ